MSYISISTSVTSIEVTGGGYNSIDLAIDGLDTDEVLKEAGITEAINFFGENDLLSEIGEDAARAYFKIEESK